MLPGPVPELSGDILKVVASHVALKYRWESLHGYKAGIFFQACKVMEFKCGPWKVMGNCIVCTKKWQIL